MDKTILTLALETLSGKGAADVAALAALSISRQANGTCLLAHEAEIPTWQQRAYNTEETPVGKPYKWRRGRYTSCVSSITPPDSLTSLQTRLPLCGISATPLIPN